MEQKKRMGFGFRGWLLVIWAATAMVSFVVVGNYPLNILSDLYGGAKTLSLVYTIASLVGIAIQLGLSSKVGKVKSWKKVSTLLAVIAIVCLFLMMVLKPSTAWTACYGIGTCAATMYATWAISVVIGVWFPTRKGTVMGVATFAFPIVNAFLGFFATGYFSKFEPRIGAAMAEKMPELVPSLIAAGNSAEAAEGLAAQMITAEITQQVSFVSFMPFFLIILGGLILGLLTVTDFPEQCGAYRDNDRTMTPEIAKKIMEQEETNRKTTVWKTGASLKCIDFWLISIPMGFLTMFAVGAMTQSQAIIAPYAADFAALGGYTGVMLLNSVFGIIGSYLFGIIDTRIGTRKSLTMAMACMVVSGILGATNQSGAVLVGFLLVGAFMGASSNFTISVAVQYWRQEDFPSVFSCINPIVNIFSAVAPSLIAFLIATALASQMVFIVIGIAGAIGFVLCMLFRPGRVKATDDKYRLAAGKPLDDALVGRK